MKIQHHLFYYSLLALYLLIIPCCTDDMQEEPPVYVIDNAAFGISSDNTNARSTTDGINAALKDAVEKGFDRIRLLPGDYRIECIVPSRWHIVNDGILVPSNVTFDLTGANLYLTANSQLSYSLIMLKYVENVTIVGGHLIGDRYEHNYTTPGSHEYGFGIQVLGSKNIVIRDMAIEKMTGDAVILSSYGYDNNKELSERVKIHNCRLYDCRRQGISVINAINSEISHNTIYDIKGTDPQFGIDIEPEQGCRAENLTIHHNRIYNCVGGISFHNQGAGSAAYENELEGIPLIAVFSKQVHIYKNKVTPPGYISAGTGATDICISGDNNCRTIVNKSVISPGWICP